MSLSSVILGVFLTKYLFQRYIHAKRKFWYKVHMYMTSADALLHKNRPCRYLVMIGRKPQNGGPPKLRKAP